MEETKREMNLYEKLARLRRRVEIMQEDKSGFQYTYVSGSSIMAKITDLMEELHLSLVPKIIPGTMKVEHVATPKKKYMKEVGLYEDAAYEYVVQAEMEFSWVNNDNPEEKITIPWVFVGSQSDPSQAFGSGLTYASRYFMLRFFSISTDADDPDNWRSKQKEAELEEEKLIVNKIIDEITREITSYLEDNPNGGPNVRKIVEKYQKQCDHTKIKEAVVASKLLEEIRNTLNKEDK